MCVDTRILYNYSLNSICFLISLSLCAIFRPFGALTFLSTLTCEVIKTLMNNNDKETWSWEARDILLDAWTALLTVYVLMHWMLLSFIMFMTCL